MSDSLVFCSTAEQNDALHERKILSAELVAQSIACLEALDGRINAVVVRDFDRARGAASVADAA